MTDYIKRMAALKKQRDQRKPQNVGKPRIKHKPTALVPTIPLVDWRFETTPARPHGVYDDGTVEVLK